MYLAKALAMALLIMASRVQAADVNGCTDQKPCLTYSESSCVSDLRTVCLGVDTMASGCVLNTDIINDMCSLVNGSSTGYVSDGTGTCGQYAGGSLAVFAVSDTNIDTSTETAAGIALAGGTGTKAGDCTPVSIQQCSASSNTGVGSALWKFTVTSCSCNCTTWAAWSVCDSNCMRNRTCTAPTTCVATESEQCPSNCTITTAAPSTTAVATSPSGNATTATTATAAGCTCGSWISIGSCQATCGTGLQSRVRSCPSTCPSDVLTSDVVLCDTGIRCAGPMVPVPPPAFGPTTSRPVCSCGRHVFGRCSVTCGRGVRLKTRICSKACPLSLLQTVYEFCEEPACSGQGFVVGGGDRRRGIAIRRGRNCHRIANRRRRRACLHNRDRSDFAVRA